MSTERVHIFEGMATVLNGDGSIAYQDPDWMPNVLADEGEASIIEVYLQNDANPSKYLALIQGGTTPPSETSTMAYLGGGAGAREVKVPGVDGYNRQQLLAAGWSEPALDTGDMQSEADQAEFGAAVTNPWDDITHAALVTAATGQTGGSGKFLAYIALAATTDIGVGQYFHYTLRWKMQ